MRKKLFCCFGGARPVSSLPSVSKKGVNGDAHSFLVPFHSPTPLAFQAISALRARCLSFASSSTPWTVRLAFGASYVAEACDAHLIGLMGATRDLNGRPYLVVLSSSGLLSAALPVGEMLPLSQADVTEDVRGQQSPLALLPWEAPQSLWSTSCAQQLSKPQPSSPRQQDSGVQSQTQPRPSAATSSSLILLYDSAWQRILGHLQTSLAAGGPNGGHVVLVPLHLGSELVGAMLMALPSMPGDVVSKPGGGSGGDGVSKPNGDGDDIMSRPNCGDKQGPRGGQCEDAEAASGAAPPPPALRDALLHQTGLFESLGACVAECCLGPVLPDVLKVCANCSLVESAVTLADLSASLKAALMSSLGADLHVDLGVRLALLPHKNAPYGVLFEDAGTTRSSVGAGGTGRAGCVPAHRSASLSYIRQGVAASTNGGDAVSGRQQQQQLGAQRSARLANGSGGGLGGKAVLQHAAANRLSVQASGSLTPDDLVPQRTHGFLTDDNGSRSFSSCGYVRRGATMRRPATSPSPQLPAKAQTKVATFSLGSTLAASLMAHQGRSSGSSSGALPHNIGANLASGNGGGSMGLGLRTMTSRGTASAFRLASTAINDVSSYLHDADQPTADVFMVFKRSGTAAGPASLLVIAAWSQGPSDGGAPASVCGGAARGGGGGLNSLRTDPGAPLNSIHAQAPTVRSCTAVDHRAIMKHIRSLGQYGGDGGGGVSSVGTTSLTGSHVSPCWDAAGMAAVGGSTNNKPAFVVYFTSALPLPTQLLGAVRDRAMALLEVLVPAASRALAGAVHDEWGSLCSQISGGMQPGAGPLSGLGPEDACDSVSGRSVLGGVAGRDRATQPFMSTATGTTGGETSAGSFAAQRLGSGSLSTTPLSPSGGLRGTNSRYALAATTVVRPAAAAAAAAAADSSTRGGPGAHLFLMPLNSTDAAAPPGSDSTMSNKVLTLTGRAAPVSAAVVTAGQSNVSGNSDGHLLLTTIVPNTDLAMVALGEEQQDSRTEYSDPHFLSGNVVGGGSTAVLTTVLSDVRDAAKAARQWQLDIMVSTFQNTLTKARNDTVALGGAHAEDDVRSLKLLKTIGQGGCSVVLLARLHAMPVAVKVILPPEDESDEEEFPHSMHPGNRPQQPPPQQQQQPGKLGPDTAQPQSTHNQTQAGTPTAEAGDRPFLADSGGSIVLLTDKTNATSTAPSDATHTTKAAGRGPAAGWSRKLSVARQMRMRMLLRGARELAVMASISHPAIVQVYSYCTRVVIQETTGVPQLCVVPEGTPANGPLCAALIMEYCDMGSLADAIDNGVFARAIRNAANALNAATKSRAAQSVTMSRTDRTQLTDFIGPSSVGGASGSSSQSVSRPAVVSPAVATIAGTVAMRAIYLTLLEVALALRHLHSLSLAHCDVKPANVLLRSSATDPRGFTAKLTDFGFVNFMDEQQQQWRDLGKERESETDSSFGRLQEPVGTVTHMAPELFVRGNVVDASIDVYAFGILMWELCTGRAPYPEYAEGQFMEVPYKVVKEGLRPRFPPDTPMHYKLLAQECWSSQVGRRPSAATLVSKLQRLLDLSCGFTQPGPGGW